jgi:hypothetical protein
MTNIFASEVQKQAFKDGVQDENRSAIPMATVSDVDTENLEVMNNRYGTDFVADSTTDGTYSVNDFTMSNDSLTISNQAVYGERIQTKDLVHAGDAWDIVNDRIDRHTRGLGVVVHRDTYSTTVNGAGLILDNEVLAGSASAGTPITMSASNPDEVATKVYSLMQDAGVAASQGRPYFMIDPSTARFFKLFGMGAGFNVADRQLMKGFEILPTFDFDYVITPEIEHEQVLSMATNITADDTITVKGVVFTAKAAPSAAGEFDVSGSADATRAIIANAINGSSTGKDSATGYFEVSAANRLILKNAGVVAVNDDTADTVTVTAYGSIAGAETFTDATDAWGTEQKNLLAGLRNSTHLALPSKGFFVDEIDQVPGFTGSELRSTQIYDSTVWTKNAPKICKILVTA